MFKIIKPLTFVEKINLMMKRFEDIDLKIEKLVFLLNAEEGNPGIYELTYELAYYDLMIEDKYKIARILLTEILLEELVILEKYKDFELKDKIATIDKNEIEKVLNNPFNWYPCNEILSISLTDKGNEYLDKEMPKYEDRINRRLGGK
ncbi:hypothetical protein NU10_01015 [Flavobacterium dauae]|uniref:hypothetical protein n=1 Tax=Flavobacterium dauae TaxID=1563479 RepID=UPI00101B44A0|nr:hypothetical protein [Flavobacterium dauae]WLD24002.1 hypothetical protein NU10_01015 [Flavobacterium dauae]